MPKRPAGQNKLNTTVQAVLGTEKRAKIVELRKKGYDYEEIGKMVSLDPKNCHSVVSEYMAEFRAHMVDEIGNMVMLEVNRLDSAIRVLHEHVMRESDARSATAMANLMARKAAYLGLDKAAKIEIETKKGYVKVSPDDWTHIKQAANQEASS